MNLQLASEADLYAALKTATGDARKDILWELQQRWDETVPRRLRGGNLCATVPRYDFLQQLA